jgi:hypothetical protein
MLRSKSDAPGATSNASYQSMVPPTRAQKLLAACVVIVLLIALVVTVPFARVPLENTAIFVPSYAPAVAINDLITSVMLKTGETV